MLVRRRLLSLSLLLLSGTLLSAVLPAAETGILPPRASEERLRKDVTYLASDECEGRGPTTRGIDRAADYIAAEFKKAGLQPGVPGGSYFQPFTIPGAIQEAPATLTFEGPGGRKMVLTQGKDFYPMGLGHGGQVKAPLAFTGYGITSPNVPYDDYSDFQAAGKVLVVLRDAPHSRDKDVVKELRPKAPFVQKLATAQKNRAAALLVVNDGPTAQGGDELLDFNYTALGGPSGAAIPILHVRRAVAEKLFEAMDRDLKAVESTLDRTLKPNSFDFKGWTARLEVKMHRGRLPLKNVVGVLEGSGPLAEQTVVVGAHYDHLGYGGAGGSLAGLKKMAIHHGADDNGSGTSALLELVRLFGAMPNRQGRRLVFIAFSGEELGLLGSIHYCKNPLFPLADTVAMFNLDMVGRLRTDPKTGKDRLLSEGSGTARGFVDLLDRLARKHEFRMVNKASGYGPSDHDSFYRAKVPVLFLWTDYHDDYHRPSDTADKINAAGMKRVVDLSAEVISHLATVPERPAYIALKETSGPRPSAGMPRLGFRPSYGDEGEGVLVGGVSEGLPAQKAGIKEGDRLIELAGKPIPNLQSYMQVLSTQKKGHPIDVVIVRNGKKVTLRVTPE